MFVILSEAKDLLSVVRAKSRSFASLRMTILCLIRKRYFFFSARPAMSLR